MLCSLFWYIYLSSDFLFPRELEFFFPFLLLSHVIQTLFLWLPYHLGHCFRSYVASAIKYGKTIPSASHFFLGLSNSPSLIQQKKKTRTSGEKKKIFYSTYTCTWMYLIPLRVVLSPSLQIELVVLARSSGWLTNIDFQTGNFRRKQHVDEYPRPWYI